MRKLLNYLAIFCLTLTLINCSSNESNESEVAQDYTNSDFIKSKMIGKWNYWGHKSPSCNCWSYNGDIYKGYFTFTNENKYTYKNEVSGDLQSGNFSITPATKTDNASLTLNYVISGQTKYRFIILKDLSNNQAIIFESSFDQRYDKE